MKRNGRMVSTSLLAMVMVLSMVLTLSVMPVGAQDPWEGYLVPQNSTGSYGADTYVDIYANATVTTWMWQVDIHFDLSCVNITNVDFTGCPYPMTQWHWLGPDGHGGYYVRVMGSRILGNYQPPGIHKLATLTLHGMSPSYCVSDIWFDNNLVSDPDNQPVQNSYTDGTFTCMAPQETFSKELVEGWNLISLPLTNTTNMTVANIMSSISSKYDALYRYDASIHSWVALSSSDTMENGVGYFIHMTSAGIWTYSGSAYTAMDIALEPGLNMVGWVNTSADLPDALNSIAGNYRYVAKWNATAQSYEVYVAGAPPAFNDFTMMERGEGYFIVATTNCTLTYP